MMARLTLVAMLTGLLGATVASCEATTGYQQMITYVKRHPGLSREEFWQYWQTQHAPKVAPLATHVGITRYQQIQVGGKIPVTAANAEALESAELVEFDGIAMFLYEKSQDLNAMLSHPYYTSVIEPDEAKFIDKSAFNKGQVATFVGTQVEVVEDKQNVWVGDGGIRDEYQKRFQDYL